MNSRDVTDQKINEKSRIAEWTSFLKNEDIQLTSEPPRDFRRLHFLRGWGHGKTEADTHQRLENEQYGWCLSTNGSTATQWGAMTSIAAKIGCTAETLRKWVRQAERDQGRRAGLTTDERQRLKELERENRELKQTNEILRKASAFFAQAELGRRRK